MWTIPADILTAFAEIGGLSCFLGVASPGQIASMASAGYDQPCLVLRGR